MKNSKYKHTTEVHNLRAPEKVVPILLKLLHPNSVLDVGCGLGTWLKVFMNNGVKDVIGIDSNDVPSNLLQQNLPLKKFNIVNLIDSFDLKRQFDIVLCLEVAEHLPESSAESFVQSLIRHSNIIVFSAAIPGQGGQNHINEQWKDYWIQKFCNHGYKFFDLLRPKIWNLQEVDYWYKQNMVVFSNKDLSHLKSKQEGMLETIHPDLFNKFKNHITYLQKYIKKLETKIYLKD